MLFTHTVHKDVVGRIKKRSDFVQLKRSLISINTESRNSLDVNRTRELACALLDETSV